jgi:DNA-binding winged helix-turn-helix (wHTH) protein
VKPEASKQLVRFEEFELDLRTRELRTNGRKLNLQEQPFQVLSMLLESPGELVSREKLTKALWPADTFVDFEHSLNRVINRLRDALEDSAEHPRFIETLPRLGYRFIAPITREPCEVSPIGVAGHAEAVNAIPTSKGVTLAAPPSDPVSSCARAATRPKRRWSLLAGLVLLTVCIAAGAFYWCFRPSEKLTEKDTLVIADFNNSTDDVVFDDTLKQALATELQQSPFLSVLSDRRARQTLAMMGRSSGDSMDGETARDVCQRVGGKVVLDGSIASLGNQYVIGLNAINCQTGDSVAREQVQAARKEEVLTALDSATTKLRHTLGESLASIQRFDTPIAQATTASFEALKEYSLGRKTQSEKGSAASIPFYKRAIELDPGFVMAYANLSPMYANLQEADLARRYIRKAYELRDHVSERERFYITAFYYMFDTGEIEKANQTNVLWQQSYPRDPLPPGNLANNYGYIGRWSDAAKETGQAMRLDPSFVIWYSNLAQDYRSLNQLADAQTTFDNAVNRGLDFGVLRLEGYYSAFLRDDPAGMEQQLAWTAGKAGDEDILLSAQSDTEAYYGRLNKAREFSRRAVASAQAADEPETAALWEVNEALREVEFGNFSQGRRAAEAALAIARGRDVRTLAALALARSGDSSRAQHLAAELSNENPVNTQLQHYWLPVIRSVVELNGGHPLDAIAAVENAASYELGAPAPFQLGPLYPIYIRGLAFLGAHRYQEATEEFQKILDHRGLIANFPLGALTQLELGKAQAGMGDNVAAHKSYQGFLKLWKDADLDVPVFKQALAEYARLQ